MIMNLERLTKILEKIKNVKIAVVGDYFLDKYLIIDPDKDEPSLETYLTAYQVVEKRLSPGAAGTVANNLHAFGVSKIIAVGFAGKDGEGYELLKCLKDINVNTNHLLRTDDLITPTYTKPMRMETVGIRELNRLDIKNFKKLPHSIESKIIEIIYDLSTKTDAILAMDQVEELNFGVVTAKVKKALAEIGKTNDKIFIYGDSRAFVSHYRNITVKCNNRELVKVMGGNPGDEDDLDKLAVLGIRMSKQNGRPVFVTLGASGIMVIMDSETTVIPAIKVEGPIDICGAGDTASAAIVSAICAGCTHEEAAFMANLAASITIQQIGATGTAAPEQIIERYKTL